MVDDDSKAGDAKTTSASKPAKENGTTKRSGRPGLLTGGLALMLSVIALIASGYIWYSLLHERPELLATDVVGNLKEINSEIATLREGLGASGVRLDEVRANQDSIREALDKIQSNLSQQRSEWMLAESEQLLVIANNRLQLARDVRSALAALRAADAQLNQLASPSLLPVRRELAREIAALESIDRVDVGGISLKLGSLAETVARLPVAPHMSLQEATAQVASAEDTSPETSWRSQASELWSDVVSLVRIRTDLKTERPLLPPEQQYFLRENLKLMLYGAQSALLQSNTDVYQQNLQNAEQLLKEYFDTDTQVVIGVLTELEDLRHSELAAELPDISRSLAALRTVNQQRGTP